MSKKGGAHAEPKQPSVIVVDDDEFLLKGLDFGLRKLGLVPTLTQNPDDFMNHLAARTYDLYLIDLRLGEGRSGLELVQKIRATLGSAPRVIMVSATGDTRTIAEALARGANDYVLKPLDREHLAAKLSRYVTTEQMQEASRGGRGGAEARAPAKLSFFADVVEVSDHGVRLQGPHYLLKGTSVWLDGELFDQIIHGDSNLASRGARLLKVTSAWIDPDDKALCGAYAEFDRSSLDPDWFRAVRRWLAERH